MTLSQKSRIASAFLMVASALVAACGSSSGGSSSTPATPTASGSASPTPVAVPTGNPSAAVTVTESGSSLLLPFLQKMVDPLHSSYSNITLAPAAGGSGKGIADAIAGTSNFGGSDAYLSNSQASANPRILNIPIAVSAQSVFVNVAGVTAINLSGDVLAKIYLGKITRWNDPAITALNPSTTLPSNTIVPVRRVDSSGDTFIFTSLLNSTNTEWANGPALGTTVTWPAVQGEVTASGNPGMIQVAQQTPNSVAYIGVSVRTQAKAANLVEAALQNRNGKFVSPEVANIQASVDAGLTLIPDDLRTSLIFASGDKSYPIVNFEYLMVNSHAKNADTAMAERTVLAYAIDTDKGSSAANLSAVNFVALPLAVANKVRTAIAKIAA